MQKPEFRMPFMQASYVRSFPSHPLVLTVALKVGMLLVPGGLLLFGWTAEAHTHFILPLLGACSFAFGMLMAYVRSPLSSTSNPSTDALLGQICIQTYLVDAFTEYAASALAATIVLRSIFGAVFSIVGTQLYKSLGYGWCAFLGWKPSLNDILTHQRLSGVQLCLR
jgi:hypothetical protein